MEYSPSKNILCVLVNGPVAGKTFMRPLKDRNYQLIIPVLDNIVVKDLREGVNLLSSDSIGITTLIYDFDCVSTVYPNIHYYVLVDDTQKKKFYELQKKVFDEADKLVKETMAEAKTKEFLGGL